MRVTVVQFSPDHAVERNVAEVEDLVRSACREDRPDLVVLPEMWSCLGGDRAAKLDAAEPLPDAARPSDAGRLHRFLRDLARSEAVVLHGGSIGERAGDKLFNTSLVFGPDGAELARYRKIHLFDVVTPSGAGYRESDLFGAGDEPVTFPAGGLTAGCAVCYDLRFPALFAVLRDRGAELIALPAAFTAETGQAHWETLVRARAIETQCWVAAAATVGRHADAEGSPRLTYGRSMICDPWGTVVAEASHGRGWATARVDRALTARIRADMPVWTHRRSL